MDTATHPAASTPLPLSKKKVVERPRVYPGCFHPGCFHVSVCFDPTGGGLLRDMHALSTRVLGRVLHQVDGASMCGAEAVLSTRFPRPRTHTNPASRPSFPRVPPGMRSIRPNKCQRVIYIYTHAEVAHSATPRAWLGALGIGLVPAPTLRRVKVGRPRACPSVAEELDRAPRRSSSLRGPRPSAHRYQAYGKDDSEFNLSISRYQLNVYLINKARPASPRYSCGRSPHNPRFQAVIIPGSPGYELFPSGGAAPRV